MRDLIECQQVERTLSQALKEQESILEAILDIVYVLDRNGHLLKWNKRLETVTGLAPEVLKGRSALAFFPATEQATIVQAIQEVLLKGKAKVEGHLIGMDEVLLPYEWNGVTLVDDAGNVVGITGIGRNITERKQAERVQQQRNATLEQLVSERTAQLEQALQLEAMLKRITDKVRDSLDSSQIVLAVVQELALVLGLCGCNAAWYDLEQGTSTICYDYATSVPATQGRVSTMADFPEIYHHLLHRQHFQFCSLVPNPVRGRVAMLACPIFDDQGVLGDLWLINQPERAFNELELRLVQQVANQCAIAVRQARLYQSATAQVEELEKLHRLKDDFLNIVSHELRTPLSNVKLALSLLEVTLQRTGFLATAPEQTAKYLQILHEESQREIDLIDDLSRLCCKNWSSRWWKRNKFTLSRDYLSHGSQR